MALTKLEMEANLCNWLDVAPSCGKFWINFFKSQNKPQIQYDNIISTNNEEKYLELKINKFGHWKCMIVRKKIFFDHRWHFCSGVFKSNKKSVLYRHRNQKGGLVILDLPFNKF